jgi:hypothetical protein
MHQEDWAMAAVQNESPFGSYLFEGARAHEVRGLSIHGRLIRQAVCPDAHSARALSDLSIQPPMFFGDQRDSAAAPCWAREYA